MSFNIDKSALQRLSAQASVDQGCISICDELRNSVYTGSAPSVGILNPSFLPIETRLHTRMALLSFEADWDAPGMEAYDAL